MGKENSRAGGDYRMSGSSGNGVHRILSTFSAFHPLFSPETCASKGASTGPMRTFAGHEGYRGLKGL